MPSLLGTGPGVHYKSLKTVNQLLKHKVNRWVLSLRPKECKLGCKVGIVCPILHFYKKPIVVNQYGDWWHTFGFVSHEWVLEVWGSGHTGCWLDLEWRERYCQRPCRDGDNSSPNVLMRTWGTKSKSEWTKEFQVMVSATDREWTTANSCKAVYTELALQHLWCWRT